MVLSGWQIDNNSMNILAIKDEFVGGYYL